MLLVIKGNLERAVPCISQIELVNQKGIEVAVICTECTKNLKSKLEALNVKIHTTNHRIFGISLIKKIMDWVGFRKKALKLIKNIYTSDSFIYIGSCDTALSLGKRVLKYKYILHVRELYDTNIIYKYLLRKFALGAKNIVVPEYCRANILKCWWKLKKLPTILPNKSYNHPGVRNLKITNDEAALLIKGIEDKKIILYQGHIGIDRSLKEIAEALREINNNEYVLLLMGIDHNDNYSKIKMIYNNTYHIKYIPAPFHLEVTSHAYIGIANYDDSTLNNIFCAPNKIYEYTGFGVPVLARDIPGLKYTIDINKAGICIDFNNMKDIINSIIDIIDNYSFYSNNAKKFYDSIDLNKIMLQMLEKASLKI